MQNLLTALSNHLWQSTLVAALLAVLTLALRQNPARVLYWIWLAASLKFLVPFSLLVSLGSLFPSASLAPVVPATAAAQVAVSFEPMQAFQQATHQPSTPWLPIALGALWVLGFGAVLISWFRRWRKIANALRNATPVPLDSPIPVVSSRTTIEPGVFGIFSPVLLLPDGIAARLSTGELDSILAHELAHVRRRDNLTAALHMFVEAIFWFHPLVWYIGARLVEERERACDDEVLQLGLHPQVYAEGILNVCKHYMESPLPCAAGVTGADLKRRISEIMNHRTSPRLTLSRKLLLASTGLAAMAVPVFIGALRAQPQPSSLSFEVATIRPSADPESRRVGLQMTPGGGMNAMNMDLRQLIAFAYNIQCGKGCDALISGGPGWIASERFDIVAKASAGSEEAADAGQATPAQLNTYRERARLRLQALLADRFQLAVRRESKQAPVYELVVAKGGHKLKASSATNQNGMVRGERGHMVADNVQVTALLGNLTGLSGRPVIDRTGLEGRWNFTLDFAPEMAGGRAGGPGGAELSGPSIFTALQEQLGLKLEPATGTVEKIVIERAERPSAN